MNEKLKVYLCVPTSMKQMGQMYYGVNCFEVIGNLVIVIELKKEIMVVGCTSKNYQIANGAKWCKMDLK